MADHKDPKDKQEYSVDDILAEYGSGKYGSSKVVEFPGPAERQGAREAQRPDDSRRPPGPEPQAETQVDEPDRDAQEVDGGIVEIEPGQSLPRVGCPAPHADAAGGSLCRPYV